MHPHDLVFELLAAAATVTKRLDRSLSGIKGISFSEFQILQALASRRAATTRADLAAAVGLTPSGVTRALKPLEELGFVETHRDARDARRSLAVLTPHGIELVDDAAGVVAETLAGFAALGELAPSDAMTVRRFLNDLAQ